MEGIIEAALKLNNVRQVLSSSKTMLLQSTNFYETFTSKSPCLPSGEIHGEWDIYF